MGPVGMRNPGRRAMAASLTGTPLAAPEYARHDSELRRLVGVSEARWGKYNTLPAGTPARRRDETFRLVRDAMSAVHARIAALVETRGTP